MKTILHWVATVAMILGLVSCAHTSEIDQQRDAYQKLAEKRVDAMEKMVTSFEVRETQLLGQPKVELAQALAILRNQVTVAKSELDKLSGASKDKWVETKSAIDKELFNMDTAYSSVLTVFAKY